MTLTLDSFILDHPIGEGGMGEVWRGEHRQTGVDVAVKVIGGRRGAEARGRFRREVQAHAGLTHPGIVYLFEYGTISPEAADASDGRLRAGDPYVAMELADRGTVADLRPIDDWSTVRSLLIQVLDALAFSHARDVIHRDLKPENFLLFDAPDHPAGLRLKLADFGIAHALGDIDARETGDLAAARGTPSYMAPEQCHGRWRAYGPWTDLYAVGCIAWELVCGRPPLQADTPFSLMVKHETADRPRLDPRFPVPDGLEAWIRRAMAVDRRERFQRVADAAAVLPTGPVTSSGGGQRTEDAPTTGTDPTTLLETRLDDPAPTLALADAPDEPTAPSQTDPPPDPIDAPAPPLPETWQTAHTGELPAPLVGTGLGLFGLREPPFVDRNRMRDRIWAALERTVDRQGPEFVWIAGAAGAGKSRLAEWMTTRAHEVGAANILRSRHDDAGGKASMRETLERVMQTFKMDRAEIYDHLVDTLPPLDEADSLREEDARALTEFLRPTDEGVVDGPRYQFSNLRQKHALAHRFLRRMSRQRPVIWWVDDIQWGPATLRVLEALCELDDQAPPVLVLATLRTDILAEEPDIAEQIDRIASKSSSRRWELDPLSRRDHRALLDGLLPLEGRLADRLTERTEGHPLFAMQLLSHWIDGEALELGPDGFRVAEGRDAELPANIHELWLERIDRLLDTFDPEATPQIMEALELAAALGRQVDGEEWARLLDRADLALPENLVERLVERGLATWSDGDWAFAHGLLVDSLARRAREAGRWQEHHRRCARVISARLGGEAVRGQRPRIAEHWQKAGAPERAIEPLLEEARLLGRCGETDEAHAILDERRAILDRLDEPEQSPRWAAGQLQRANTQKVECRYDSARNLADQVHTQSDPDAHPRTAAGAALILGMIDRTRGETQSAERWLDEAHQLAERAENPVIESRARLNLGWIAHSRRQLDAADRHATHVRQFGRQSGDLFFLLRGQRLQGLIEATRGNEEAALDQLESARRGAEESGYRALEARSLNDLGERARFADQFDRARHFYRDYYRIMREMGRPFAMGLAKLNLAQLELRAGNLYRAEKLTDDSEQTFVEIDARDAWETTLRLLRLGLAAGEEEWANFDRSWRDFEGGWPEESPPVEDHIWLLRTIAGLAAEAGDVERAERVGALADGLDDS